MSGNTSLLKLLHEKLKEANATNLIREYDLPYSFGEEHREDFLWGLLSKIYPFDKEKMNKQKVCEVLRCNGICKADEADIMWRGIEYKTQTQKKIFLRLFEHLKRIEDANTNTDEIPNIVNEKEFLVKIVEETPKEKKSVNQKLHKIQDKEMIPFSILQQELEIVKEETKYCIEENETLKNTLNEECPLTSVDYKIADNLILETQKLVDDLKSAASLDTSNSDILEIKPEAFENSKKGAAFAEMLEIVKQCKEQHKDFDVKAMDEKWAHFFKEKEEESSCLRKLKLSKPVKGSGDMKKSTNKKVKTSTQKEGNAAKLCKKIFDENYPDQTVNKSENCNEETVNDTVKPTTDVNKEYSNETITPYDGCGKVEEMEETSQKSA